jgi:two-component system sensor histidine kinase RegB
VPLFPIEPPQRAAPALGGRSPERLAGRKNLLQLTQLRWLAVAGQLATILTVQFVLGLDLPLLPMLGLLAGLVAFNLACVLRARAAREIRNAELFAGLLVDVLVLSAQLFFSGGVTNPFIFLFLLQVAVAAVLLQERYIWAMVMATCLCFLALTQWHRPLALPELSSWTLSVHYIGGLLICFVLNAALLVIFIGRIGRNLRQRDARLADLRQRAAEADHIVRMGLLATGAAHELGTPLATLSVILGDWAHMAPFTADPALHEELDDMQTQLQRCKAIVSGILMSAGEARGEAPVPTSLHSFLDALVAQWRLARQPPLFDYQRSEVPDQPIVSDTALKQMIGNVLDNALEAAPQAPLRLVVACEDDTLLLRVLDRGPGFSEDMLAHFGQPYQSTKGKPGRGLGLFLSVNVARMLGGHITARNRTSGGAEVAVSLPLAALSLQERRRLDPRPVPAGRATA